MLPTEGFAAAAVALDKSRSDWAALSTAAGNGTLRMEPGAAETAAQLCEQLIADLDSLRTRARNMILNAGMGDCLVGQQLAAKFNDKAVGPTNSLVHVITLHQQVPAAQAETYRRAGSAIAQQDASTENAFREGA